MPVSNAWLLTFSNNVCAAVGSMELVHILPSVPELSEIPHSPSFCKYSISWEGHRLPVMDILTYLDNEQNNMQREACYNNSLIGVVAYIDQEKKQQAYGALLLQKLPVRIEVDDKQACNLPESPPDWSGLAISCFKYNDKVQVPIIDIQVIFSKIIRKDN